MRTASTFVTALFMAGLIMGSSAGCKAAPNPHIKSVAAITQVFGDGQKVVATAVEYDQSIAGAKLTNSAFSVDKRTITRIYTNDAQATAAKGVDGKYVIIELSPSDPAAAILPPMHGPGGPRTGGPGGPGGPDGNAGGPPPSGFHAGPRLPAKVAVKQVGEVVTASGEKYPAAGDAIENSKTINPIVDDFVQREFKDAKTGKTVRYNLYIPKNYDKSKSYPLVNFMHDASVTGGETERTLIQGNGAIIWATPEEQAKHPAFVLAPTYEEAIAYDDFKSNEMVDTTVDLINAIASEYNIDRKRLYTTGQSGGCMMSIQIDIKYPDLFAASMLVAGQWDPKGMAATMTHQKIWIIVAEGDTRAFPGMNASLAAMEAAGAKVARGNWSARLSPAETNANDKKLLAQGANIMYTVYDKGTVFPAGQEGGMEHMETWKHAYLNEGVRDWLFQQHK